MLFMSDILSAQRDIIWSDVLGVASDGESYRLSSFHYDKTLGLDLYYLQQTYHGLDILDQISTVAFGQSGEIRHKSTRRAAFSSVQQSASKMDARKVWKKFTSSQALKSLSQSIIELGQEGELTFQEGKTTARAVYVIKEKSLVLTFEFTYADSDEWKQTYLDAVSGVVIEERSFTTHCSVDHIPHKKSDIRDIQHTLDPQQQSHHHSTSCNHTYRVFNYPLLSPLDGERSLVQAPWSKASNASPMTWHDTTITRGNNVFAYTDISGTNTTGHSPNGGEDLCFDYPLDLAQEPVTQRDASITNLFYWNNLIHDVMFQYGFDETSGNFQETNFSGQGYGGDGVRAEGLDGGDVNNATFATFPDGIAPRMQMHIWNPGVYIRLTPVNGMSKDFNASVGNFVTNRINTSGTGALSEPSLGCGSLSNAAAINGRIAVIDRGDCTFVDKVLNAQNAGAIAVIICNSADNHFSMGASSDLPINIPAVMTSKSSCNQIKIHLDNAGISLVFNRPVDSGFDNGIIVHEYAHGVSNRLTGGSHNTGCLSNTEQMGEGWSDWYALMFGLSGGDTGEMPIGLGSYADSKPLTSAGIRQFPYTTDILLNPMTYDWIKFTSVPHGLGSVWAAMLWELTWQLIDEHGFDDDLYYGNGGNNIALRLVTTALKLQPCSPGFVDGRDAILASDRLLYNGRNQCLIWRAFAKRGLGFSASQGSSASRSDGLEAFDLPELCTAEFYMNKSFTRAGVDSDTITFTITLRNNGLVALSNIVLIDSVYLPHLSYIPGSLNTGQMNHGEIKVNISELTPNGETTIDYKCVVHNISATEARYVQGWEYGLNGWETNSSIGSAWKAMENSPFMGIKHAFVQNDPSQQISALTSHPLVIEDQYILGIRHKMNVEREWDGGIIRIAKAGTNIWKDAGPHIIRNGYTGTIRPSAFSPLAGYNAFTGHIPQYIWTIIDLSDYQGDTIQLNVLFASDASHGIDGWYIDDIGLYKPTSIDDLVCVFYDGTSLAECRYNTLKLLSNAKPCAVDVLAVTDYYQSHFQANKMLKSDSEVKVSGNFTFVSGQEVVLSPGFSTGQSSSIEIAIENCNND